MSNAQEHVWAFDLGKASIGEAVRVGTEFKHKASLLIPHDFAETKSATNRRRMWRTREARAAREGWLEKVWEAAGLEVLRGRQVRKDENGKWSEPIAGDERLEREFAESPDDTCYTSCLLRIKLLRGEKLEPWQIYKALRSAIQKRGYDPKIAWAEKEERRTGKKTGEQESEQAKKDPRYAEALNKWRQFKHDTPVKFHFPCYFDASKMGLWSASSPSELNFRTTHAAESTRNVRFDREDVEREIAQLASAAAQQLAALAKAFEKMRTGGWRVTDAVSGCTAQGEKYRGQRVRKLKVLAKDFGSFISYGPGGRAYAAYDPATVKQLEIDVLDHPDKSQIGKRKKLRPGTELDWLGALGQRIPRFDNRILDGCVLIPRFHVCKADIRLDKKTGRPFPESLLPAEVTFLMKLKNTLVADGKGQRKLRVEEVRQIFSTLTVDMAEVKPDTKNWHRKVAECFKLTKSDWGRTKGIKELELRPLPNHEEVKPPKDSGRSRFSRPALRLMKELILSGNSPREFQAENIGKLNGNGDPTKGFVREDLKFLFDMGDSWEDIYVPAQKLDALASRHSEGGELDHDAAIADLLGQIKDPVVRHRLTVFAERLRTLRQRFGVPEQIVLEFVREDFMSDVRKRELLNFQREREKKRKEAREKAAEAGASERSAPLKYELWKAQGGICLYTGKPLPFTNLDNYCIEHVVPRNHRNGVIGPDAMVNYVLTTHEINEAKGARTPFEWFHEDMPDEWDAYVQRVKSRATEMRNKKVRLLVQENAPELVKRYTALAETAWVAKLAQTIASLMFGWTNGCNAEGVRCVTIVSGGLTARIRRKYHLNGLLNPCPAGENPLLWEEKCEKNRDDDRHHALDAMVISFIPGWAHDQSKEHFFRFPPPIHQNAPDYFGRELKGLVPQFLCFEKSVLAETIYGVRYDDGQAVVVQRGALPALAMRPTAPGKSVLDLTYARKQVHCIRDATIRERLLEFLATNPDECAWRKFCKNFCLKGNDGSRGPRVEFVTMTVGGSTEYKDLSKDQTGALRKALQGHKGQVVYLDSGNKPRIRPIYVFESIRDVNEEIRRAGGRVYGFFRSGCLVRIEKPIAHNSTPLEPGIYRLNTIFADGRARVTGTTGKTSLPISIAKFIEAQLKPLHALETLDQAAREKERRKAAIATAAKR
jgi:CRISPR-associated endonuclease Csn1